jgi:uncharacterized protein (DUF169 family)
MTDYRELEDVFMSLGLKRRPVAVAYRDSEPGDVKKFNGTVPSGCTFWKLASEGKTFYTVPGDHFNCAVGSYTHNIALPADRTAELPETLAFMTGLGYLKMEEVPSIARLDRPPAAVIYAPLGDTPVDPDVVVLTGSNAQLMLLEEAAGRAGCGVQASMGRPTCMALPAAMKLSAIGSSGCIGNRVYTGLPDSDAYLVLSTGALTKVAAELPTIMSANAKLEDFHGERLSTLTSVQVA